MEYIIQDKHGYSVYIPAAPRRFSSREEAQKRLDYEIGKMKLTAELQENGKIKNFTKSARQKLQEMLGWKVVMI